MSCTEWFSVLAHVDEPNCMQLKNSSIYICSQSFFFFLYASFSVTLNSFCIADTDEKDEKIVEH